MVFLYLSTQSRTHCGIKKALFIYNEWTLESLNDLQIAGSQQSVYLTNRKVQIRLKTNDPEIYWLAQHFWLSFQNYLDSISNWSMLNS